VSRFIPPEEKYRIIRLYELGMTIRAIMRETGRSYGGVHHTLFMAGVKLRKRGKERVIDR
jgi:hypothetical protein